VLECLRAVAQGNIWIENSMSSQVAGYLSRRNLPRLTRREQEIVGLICRGMKNKQIGEALAITTGTVKVHLMHIFEKTGVKDRFELALEAHKLVPGEAREGESDSDTARVGSG
ncbi:MAG: response regulator transcription factor, partial [Bryobacteraceae bacterium]